MILNSEVVPRSPGWLLRYLVELQTRRRRTSISVCTYKDACGTTATILLFLILKTKKHTNPQLLVPIGRR